MALLSKNCGERSRQKFALYKVMAIMAMVCFTLPMPRTFCQTPIGYWSSGIRLGDSSTVPGEGIEPGDLPEYMVLHIPAFSFHPLLINTYAQCGGAHTRKRPTSLRRRRTRDSAAAI